MSDELVLDSLQRRMRALHSLYVEAVATMDLDQVNHFEREGVLPIAFSLFHIVNMMDASFLLMTRTRSPTSSACSIDCACAIMPVDSRTGSSRISAATGAIPLTAW